MLVLGALRRPLGPVPVGGSGLSPNGVDDRCVAQHVSVDTDAELALTFLLAVPARSLPAVPFVTAVAVERDVAVGDVGPLLLAYWQESLHMLHLEGLR